MGHTPGGVNNQSSSSSSSGRGYHGGRGKGKGRGQMQPSSSANNSNGNNSSSSADRLGTRNVKFAPKFPSAPPAASLPRFPEEPPSIDELEADPQAAQLLQQAMATLRRNRQQGERGVITVSYDRDIMGGLFL